MAFTGHLLASFGMHTSRKGKRRDHLPSRLAHLPLDEYGGWVADEVREAAWFVASLVENPSSRSHGISSLEIREPFTRSFRFPCS